MAAKKTADTEKTTTRKPKSLKIERKKKPSAAKKAPRVKLTIKQAKLDRVVRKSRTIVRRALKKAVRGMGLKRIPDKLYKKIDTAIAKNTELTTIVETAVVNAVNELPALKNGKATATVEKKPKTHRTRKAKEVAAAAPVATTNGKKNGNGKKKEAEPAATEA